LRYDFKISHAKIARTPAPLPFNFCFSPGFVSQQSRAFSFSFCAELFSFSLSCSAGLRRVSQKKKIFKKNF